MIETTRPPRYAVVIPVRDTDRDKVYQNPSILYFTQRGVLVVLSVNGPESYASYLSTRWKMTNPLVKVVAGGAEYNPYKARNLALKILDSGFLGTFDFYVLTDFDCEPDEDYHDRVFMYANRESLVAGRTLTRIPDISTAHFNALREANFECYDGFTPPHHTVGSNMIIGSLVYRMLGPMRENVVSGGDGCYGIEWEELGNEVKPAEYLIVRKTIEGMSLQGILEKQLRRALCFPKKMVNNRPQIIHDLRMLFKMMDESIAALDVVGIENSPKEYAEFVDKLFKLQMHLGTLCQHVDRRIE